LAVHFSPYMERVGLQAGLTLACAFPFAWIASRHSRTHRWGLLLFVASLVVLDIALLEIPRLDGFRHLHWSWQESLLTSIWPFLMVSLVPTITFACIGVAGAFHSGWLKPSIVALLAALSVPVVFFILGARKSLDWEGWAFLLIMPGLAEELVFRGVYQSLLNRVFGRPWRLCGAEFGWGLVITAILFAGVNGLITVDPEVHARIVFSAAIAPIMLSFVSGWVRERSNSVWPSVVGHNLSNLVIPALSLLAASHRGPA